MCDLKKIGIFAVLMAIVAQIVHTIEAIFTMSYYTDPQYFQVWSKIMMPGPGAPPSEFYIYSFVFALVGWVLFGYVYEMLGGAIKEKEQNKRGLKFGALIFLVAGVPMTLMLFLLINLPIGMLLSWAVSGLALDLIGGMVAARMIQLK